jgi:pimeloyl-ACP methyl ester carboxylesterase
MTVTITARKTGLALINGIELYHAIYGTGYPLILLHGGIGAIEMFEPILPMLATGRQVIGVDLQAHGRTADIDRAMTYEAMADDIAALIEYLGFEQADVMGYSLGGGTALQTAIRHPNQVRKLIAISTAHKRDSWYPEVLAGMSQIGASIAEMMKQGPPYTLYSQIAPQQEDWPVLLNKIGDLLRKDYDWTEAVAALKIPTLLVFGDADSISPANIAQFYALLGGGQGDPGWDGSGVKCNSQLAILPGTTHYNILESPALLSAVLPFLNAPMPQTVEALDD